MVAAVEIQISSIEERLRQAMLASDVKVLDELLAPEIIITNHLGKLLTKQDDLAAHQSGLIQIDEIIPFEQQIQVLGEVSIVSVRMEMIGSYAGQPANGNFRFTRVWTVSGRKNWQIVAAHIGIVT
ncbi:MAG: nuclear transport factor 2 family protein [Hydrococcus sp. SU_1_0]|nr:nuclear transport factor 2 family protein [Hydrococcus sp. SU_1_0]